MAFLSSTQLAGGELLLVRGDVDDRLDLAAWIGAPSAETGVRVRSGAHARCAGRAERRMAARVLHVERFQAKTFGESQGAESFEVVASRSDLVVTVDRGCSILEMLENAGIGVPSSCLEGVCGTCETAVVDGAPEHRDSILTPTSARATRR